jgi:hypothetical protein
MPGGVLQILFCVRAGARAVRGFEPVFGTCFATLMVLESIEDGETGLAACSRVGPLVFLPLALNLGLGALDCL